MNVTVQQSGVIPYRVRAQRVEVLLVTSIRTGRWQLPKGMLEPGLTPRESAEQEALEEAGVLGIAHEEPVTGYIHWKQGVLRCAVTLYAMPVARVVPAAAWEEAGVRSRRWATLDEAEGLITSPDIRRCLSDFRAWCILAL